MMLNFCCDINAETGLCCLVLVFAGSCVYSGVLSACVCVCVCAVCTFVIVYGISASFSI